MQKEYYPRAAVREMLDLSQGSVRDLQTNGALISRKHGERHVFEKHYIDTIVPLWKSYPQPLRKMGADSTYFKLLTLQWEYDQALTKQRRNEIVKQCKEMVASGKAHTQTTFAVLLQSQRETVRRWARDGRFVAVRINRTYYLSNRLAQHLAQRKNEGSSFTAASGKLGIEPSLLRQRLRRGTLRAYKSVDGIWRVSPQTLLELENEFMGTTGEALWTVEEAAHQLNTNPMTLRSAVTRGHVASVGAHASLRIPESEVKKWEERFAHVNPEFRWLEDLLTRDGTKPRTVNSKVVMRAFGINRSQLCNWCNEGMLPFYVWSFDPGTHTSRSFVHRYVLGLRKFAGAGPKVDLKTARRYFDLCKSNNQIM